MKKYRHSLRLVRHMLRSVLTLLVRALREDARLLRSHLVRFLLLAFVLWCLTEAHRSSGRVGAAGLNFFSYLSMLNLIGVTVFGVCFFSSAITEEKEEQTLGLLTMAGISPLALLLGKSTARLVGALLLLTAQFPFTLLAVTLGGVTKGQVLAAYCSLLAYTVFLANLALVCSVVCRRSSGAAWMTGIALGALALLTEDSSPLHRLHHIIRIGISDNVVGYQVVTNVAGAAGCFLLAWMWFEPFTAHERPTAAARFLPLPTNRRTTGRFGSRAWSHPFIWKDFHFISGGWPVMFWKLLLYPWILPWGVLSILHKVNGGGGSIRNSHNYGEFMMGLMLFVFVLELAFYASRVFRDEVQGRTLANLAMLPTPLGQIAYAKVAGCLLAIFPAALYFVLGAMLAPNTFERALDDLIDEPAAWYFALQAVLFVYLTALFSLFVKWGALPLAFGVIFLLNGVCISCVANNSSSPDGEFFLGFMSLMTAGVVLAVHGCIQQRLEELAGQ